MEINFKQITGPLESTDRYYEKRAIPKIGMLVALHNVFPPCCKAWRTTIPDGPAARRTCRCRTRLPAGRGR